MQKKDNSSFCNCHLQRQIWFCNIYERENGSSFREHFIFICILSSANLSIGYNLFAFAIENYCLYNEWNLMDLLNISGNVGPAKNTHSHTDSETDPIWFVEFVRIHNFICTNKYIILLLSTYNLYIHMYMVVCIYK